MKEKEAKKKAAILTWCNNNGSSNYGQILQCYAVQRIVESWGYETFVVLYQREELLTVERTRRGKKFNRFIEKFIHCTTQVYTKEGVERVTREADLLVCGSDQIWNPVCFDPIYFLDFGREEQKRVAFSVSGIFEDSEENRSIYLRIAKLIEPFEKVTFRERTGMQILKKYSDKEIGLSEDPTLQLEKAEWDKIAVRRMINEDYIFYYSLGSSRPHQLIVRKVAEKYGVNKIVFIPSNIAQEGILPGFTPVDDAGPAEFITLVKYAKAVCTDSFHGITMSMKYEIPFFALKRVEGTYNAYSSDVRIRDLLEEKQMEARMVRNVQDVEENLAEVHEEIWECMS